MTRITIDHRQAKSFLAPRSSLLIPRAAFTLVELLVVITIIGILAALITVAAVGALKTLRKTQIKTEINQIAGGFDEYKNKVTAYPPNAQTDGTGPLREADILVDIKRHIKQIASRSQESDSLASVLTGQAQDGAGKTLEGGITAAEAIVFWLGGFSSDPKFPISGEGGPSYEIPSFGAGDANANKDPIESRKWVYPFDVSRLGPRDPSTKYFSGRFIEYVDPSDSTKKRRINFWTYTPAKLTQPFVYFDTSRHPAGVMNSSGKLSGSFDPPAATYTGSGDLGSVYAFKKVAETVVTGTPAIQYINPDKFQVIHCGIDDAWDKDNFAKVGTRISSSNVPANYLLFPTGPFVGEIADTEVNFAVETTIEDSQK